MEKIDMERVGCTTETTGSVGSLGSHAVVILAIVIRCAALGTIEDYRVEKSMEALKRMAAPTAKVIWNGRETVVSASEIVLGDIVLLTHGDKVQPMHVWWRS